jgi:hypothetical protein
VGGVDLPPLFMAAGAILPILTTLMVWCLVRRRRPEVILDGSNVMHWNDGAPDLATVRDVLDAARRSGFAVGVMFDANAGYLLTGRNRHDDWFAARLGLPVRRVMVVPRGVQADGVILRAACDRGARIITNDRFRDWAELFPDVRRSGWLIRGRHDGSGVGLDLDR